MILPQTYLGTWIIAILGLLCAGAWASTFKLPGKLRFELYYIDFAIGLGIAAVVFAFTFGNLGYDGFSVMDDMLQAHKRQWMDVFGAGVVFNLANLFLMGAISVSGMSVAMPLAWGVTLLSGVLLVQLRSKTTSPLFLLLGCALILAAIVGAAIASKSLAAMRKQTVDRQGRPTRRAGAVKGLILAVVSGLLMAAVYPLLNLARTGDATLGPYSILLLMGVGAFLSTFIFSLFFMNLPVEGQALEVTDYFKMHFQRHVYGVMGGILWCTGTVAALVASSTAPEAQLGQPARLVLSNGGPLLAGLIGLLVWKEFAEGGGRPKGIIFAAIILFVAGLALVALAG